MRLVAVLVKIEAAADFDDVAVVHGDLMVVQVGIELDFQDDIHRQQALAQLGETLFNQGQRRIVVVATD